MPGRGADKQERMEKIYILRGVDENAWNLLKDCLEFSLQLRGFETAEGGISR